ncbi:MAG: HAD family hydrolase [Oscillospiraceae bacterium]|nr:HAD family hydrolase [Oscillospiraceae bacterium]
MRVSFDLDEVLFVSPETHKVECPLRFPFNHIYRERLRLGTPELINTLQKLGYEVWIYTSSYRSENYIRGLFRHYGVRLDGIVNAQRHLREVQGDRRIRLPQKVPSHYRISLHVDDESVICTAGREYGFRTYQLDADDDSWKDRIIQRAEEIKNMEELQQAENSRKIWKPGDKRP